jgi:hypothetical protein
MAKLSKTIVNAQLSNNETNSNDEDAGHEQYQWD